MDLIIIGAGAAGLFAAAIAARRGLSVTLLDKNKTPGKKLRITGKGRCNLTNNCTRDEFFDNITRNKKFLYSAYEKFSAQDTMHFFEEIGVPLKTERGNRVFPQSDNANDIADALVRECKKHNVKFIEFGVQKILHNEEKVIGVSDGKTEISAENILLATGGKSYPGTGSDGNGYALARDLGADITDIRPSLVPLVTKETFVKEMRGLSLRNVKLTIIEHQKEIFSEQGEMLFTDYGITGPLVLSASAHINNPENATAHIDLKTALDFDVLDKRILRDFIENPNRIFANALDKLLPASMRPVIVMRSGINPEKRVNAVTKTERENLIKLFKDFSLTVTNFRPIAEAIITRGGISTKEINPKTMAYKKLKNLYFAGEIIDLDAYTGGFNLQIAFTTAYTATNSI
jgi:predicted Rossmann fold flavoprotein